MSGGPLFDPVRERGWDDWWAHVLLGDGDTEAVAHEAFCAGWEAAAPAIRADERERSIGDFGQFLNGPQAEKIIAGAVRKGMRAGRDRVTGAMRLVHRLSAPGGGHCASCRLAWPCPTEQAIASLLRDEAPAPPHPADRLVAGALHLRACGERAPGGGEAWAGWERAAQEYLRGLAP